MLKYASTEILGAEIAHRGFGLMRNAHRATFQYEPKHGMLYVRSRMISSRCNDNFDEFPGDEIRAGWPTFLGKPVFVNHNNDDHRRMRGLIIDAVLHEDRNPDGSPDIWVEGLMEVDALRFPKLAKAIIAGHIDRTSMGVDVAFSVCAACGNKATTPLEYCAHIPSQKGRKFARYEASTGTRKTTLIRERCHGLRFFENSLLVEEPADPTAFFLGSVETGPGLEHLSMSRTASRNTPSPAPVRMTAGPVWEEHPTPAALPFVEAGIKIAHGGYCQRCDSDDTIITSASGGMSDCFTCGANFPFTAKPKYPHPGDHPYFQQYPVHADHVISKFHEGNESEHEAGRRWYSDGKIISGALGDLHEKLHGNVHPQGNLHMAAHVVSGYSPQVGWHANLYNAARTLHTGKPVGGEGGDAFASDWSVGVAHKLIHEHQSGSELLRGPKTHAFAHLLEHGGMDPHTGGHSDRVVVDRHALSVASGARISPQQFSKFPSSIHRYYDHAAQTYRDAAAHISAHTGQLWAPHMVQAATWLTQQRHNEDHENELDRQGLLNPQQQRARKGREKGRQNDEQRWNDWSSQHIPDAAKGPGVGYSNNGPAARTGSRQRTFRTSPGRRVASAQDDERVRAEAAGPRYPNPADHPVFQQYQPSPEHIVNHYDDADEGSRHQGGRWYEDAHHIASAVGQHTGVGKHVAAGLMAAFSPQMQFHPALHNAVRTMHEGEAVQPGQGPYVTRQHAASANKILQGEHHQDALGGAKSQDMAHLVEHGGRDPEGGGWSHRAPMGHVEFAVAAGMGYSDPDTEKDARKVLGNRHYYDHLSGMYHQAAQHLNERDGTSLAAHHVQATCALHSAALADADDGHGGGAADRDRDRASKYITKQHPDLGGGNIHLSYGETKAPAQVDTLRDEACPVCGETEAWDGDNCMVCGFVAPPDKFQDPNVDLAKQVDLRAKDQGQLVAGDVPGLNMDTNDADGDGLDDNTGEPVDGQSPAGLGGAPMLTCPNCGFEVEGGQPVSVDTAQPQGLPNADSPEAQGPAEGDLCPACGKAPLQSAEQLVEEGELPPEADGMPDADPSEVDEKVEDDEQDPSPFEKKESDPEATVDGDEEDNPEEDEDDDEDDDDDETDPKKPARPTPGFR